MAALELTSLLLVTAPPTHDLVATLARFPPAVQTSIARYHREKDRLLSLAAHVLKRTFVCRNAHVPGKPWTDIVISTDQNGRPTYSVPIPESEPPDSNLTIDFNVSHQAQLAALFGLCSTLCASDACSWRVGIDITFVDERDRDMHRIQSEGLRAFLRTFEDVFSEAELTEMESIVPSIEQEHDAYATVWLQLRRFYAFWALKEAFVKMTGEALLAPWLRKLEFRDVIAPSPPTQQQQQKSHTPLGAWGQTRSDFKVFFDGTQLDTVKMEITALGERYMLARCVGWRGTGTPDWTWWKGFSDFEFVDPKDQLAALQSS